MTTLWIDQIDSALGPILVVSDGAALCALDFAEYESRLMTRLHKRFGAVQWLESPNPQGFADRLRAYLAGAWDSWQDVPVNPGGTPFQQRVWGLLRSLPAGQVITYAELAHRIGQPKACRAVGMANSQNPIAIALPCHRVIGANGQLTGYAGGLARKRWLLHHEGVRL